MSTDALLEPLLQSSHLPTLAARLSRIVMEEEQKRRDFYEWLDEDKRAEFVLGELIIHSPARLAHMVVLQRLESLLMNHWEAKDGNGIFLREQAMMRLERSDVVPDLAYWSAEKSQHFKPDTKLFPTPDFVVEVLSPSTERYDRGKKAQEYAANGVREYWLVHPEERFVEQYALKDESFELKVRHTVPDDTVDCIVLDGLRIPLKEIFDNN